MAGFVMGSEAEGHTGRKAEWQTGSIGLEV